MEVKENLYFVQIYSGLSGSSDVEKKLYNRVAHWDHKVVTESVKNKLIEILQQEHKEFFKSNPRSRKDKNLDIKPILIEGSSTLELNIDGISDWRIHDSYEVVRLGGRGESACVRFYPKQIISWDEENGCFEILKQGGENE